MPLSNQDKRQYKSIGHHLKPVLIIGDKGLTPALLEELDRRLEDHELIKVRVNAETREDRDSLIDSLCQSSSAELAQRIGNIALLYRPARKPNPKLSNLLRFQDQ